MTAFIRVIPHEVAQHGAAAAIVLAHIRFRCASDGPGRFERDGHQWWRVSHQALGREVGLSRKSVMSALKALDGVVLANHFPPLDKQERAYRIASGDDALTCQSPETDSSDLPESRNGQGGVPNGTGTGPDRDSALSLENLEKGGEAAGSHRAADRPPVDSQTANGKPTYSPRCDVHIHDEKPPPCGGCREARRDTEAAADTAHERAAAERTRIRKGIDECPDCDLYGRLDDQTDCPKHPNFRTAQVNT